MPDEQPLDATELLKALARHDVDYVIIGGVALQAHGHVRTTHDLDVIADWTPQNMQHLAAALGDLAAQLRGVDAHLLDIDLQNPQHLHDGGNFLMHTRHGDLDVFAIAQTQGAPRSYQELRARAIPIQLRDLALLIAHPEHLIRMKIAASQFRDRPEAKRRQDLDDIAVLEHIRTRHQPTIPPGAPPRAAAPRSQQREPPKLDR